MFQAGEVVSPVGERRGYNLIAYLRWSSLLLSESAAIAIQDGDKHNIKYNNRNIFNRALASNFCSKHSERIFVKKKINKICEPLGEQEIY